MLENMPLKETKTYPEVVTDAVEGKPKPASQSAVCSDELRRAQRGTQLEAQEQ